VESPLKKNKIGAHKADLGIVRKWQEVFLLKNQRINFFDISFWAKLKIISQTKIEKWKCSRKMGGIGLR